MMAVSIETTAVASAIQAMVSTVSPFGATPGGTRYVKYSAKPTTAIRAATTIIVVRFNIACLSLHGKHLLGFTQHG